MAPLHCRPATPSDAEAIARLVTELGYPTTAGEMPERLQRLATHHGLGGGHGGARGIVLLAQRGERIVGLASAHVLSVLNRPRDVAWLTALVVEEGARGAGVGRALVEAIEAFAREAGCERLSVTTHEGWSGARAFYPRVGLAPTGRRFGKTLA